MFLGSFTQKLLAKSQVVLTSKLRSNINGKRAILAKGFDKCVYGFTPETWEKLAQAELLKPLLTEEGRRMRQKVFSQAEEIDFDVQGRFVLPGYMREYAGLVEDLVFIGAGDHFEIWDKGAWEKLNG